MIKYTIEKSKYEPCYILWKESTSNQGICYRGIFKGTRNECLERKKIEEKGEK